MTPTSIKRYNEHELTIIWENGHESLYPITYLRDSCPCAGCAGETVLLHKYVPPPPDTSTPGRYDLKQILPVGSYAVQMVWGDGHNAGMYTWDYLLYLCPCVEHGKK